MSEYLNMFRDEVERARNGLRENDLYREIFERMKRYWIPIPSVDSGDYEAVGVDSSSQSIELSNGYTLIVARACAVSREGTGRKLKAYLTTGEVNELKGRIMENMEHEILLDNLHPVNLVDGSMYGRASHIPHEFRNDGFENFTLLYYENYTNLMEEVKRRKQMIMGISKSSASTFLRDVVVKEMYDEELEKNGLEKDEKLRKLPYDALDRKGKAMIEAKKLLLDKGYEKAYNLIMELTRKRPDMSILSRFGVGMSRPVMLGSSARARRSFKEIMKHGKEALQKTFRSLNIDDSHVDIVLKYLNLPAFVSFYISFSPGLVLRVDFPAYLLGLERRMQDVYWPEVLDNDVDNILSVLKSEYADNYVHSIHLFAADKDARLPYEDFFDRYVPMVESILNVTPSSGDMRYMFRR